MIYCAYDKSMQITYDPQKRNKTLIERALDFADAEAVFAGHHFTAEDLRHNYGEVRFISIGLLQGRVVVLVWTPGGEVRRIISMRKANEREQALYAHRMG